MNTLQRMFAGFLGLAILLQPMSSLAAELRFSSPVVLSETSSPADVLRQSDAYNDGTLTLDGHTFVIDEYGHAVLQQPEEGWFCAWFGWWCPELSVGEMTFDQESAKQRVIAQVVSAVHAEMVKDTGQVLPILAFAYPEPLAAGTVVYQERSQNKPLNVLSDSWFFFLDLEPDAFFDHRAQFVLVDANTGEITSQRVYSAPVIHGRIHYLDLSERWTSMDRFYPVDLTDMPPAGDWPLKVQNGALDRSPASPPSTLKPQAAAPGTPAVSTTDLPWFIPSAFAEAAPAAAAVDPCAGKPRKKVAITIVGEGPNTKHNDGLVDGEIMGNSEHNMVNVFGDMGVPYNDIHRFNPENTPKLEDVEKKIKEITKDLGPCDKVFLYIYGHGTITDEDGDDRPDQPSWGIAYGHGDDAEILGKDRWSEYSLIGLMESMKAQDINLILESCYSGSFRQWMATDAANPAEGSNWHVFLASGSLKPSYGHGGDMPGAYYTDALSACISKKLAERGLVNPTIEQIEDVMRECQKEFNDAPTHLIAAPPVEEVKRVTYTISPSVRVKEGDGGVTYAEFTITRTPADDTDVEIEFKTYDPDPEGDVSNYPGPTDYQWLKKSSRVHFDIGQATAVIRIAVFGDTVPEEDETFGVWFTTIGQARLVTIEDDDKPVAAATSSSTAAAVEEQKTTIGLAPISFGLKDLNGIGYRVLEGADDYVLHEPVTITVSETITMDDGRNIPETKCPNCEDLAEQAMLQADVCSFIQQELDDAKAEVADLDRQIASAEKNLKAARDALQAFQNPKSYAESNGKRVTSSDLRAEREWSAGLWSQYRAGDMSAEQLSDQWKAGMSDAERQRVKDDIKNRLEQDIAAIQSRLENIRGTREDVAASMGGLTGELAECEKEFGSLLAAWMDCEDSCNVSEAETAVAATGGDGALSSASSATKSSSSSSSTARLASSSSSSAKSSSSAPHRDVWSSSSSSSAATTARPQFSSSQSSSSAPSVSQCPSGTTSDRGECEEVCGHEGGTCTVSNGCYSCEVAQCPSGTFTNDCPASCAAGCDVVGQDGSTQCLQCKKSCTEVCANYAQVGTNWNTYIQSQLNQYSCVSAATVATESTTIGSCSCSNQPTVEVNTAVPVCKGTPCGDVSCGGSATCQQGESTVVIHCNWGGWKNVGENQFQPILGQ